ncbi:DUF4397 domain-containing protein [Hymenobacter psychrotolerans]|uniref:DUF4397 domain-containing protein n=1 Tax=Hymenobacter psychrotolerans DSM 18569 TaxID=1121959 RepID=A0A1M6R888_9BACT|nr:DUF4397 domain-containing protein [Hymenobacter psychrotolerans]SHK28695.1 protein of unknown function [Hymenobacter psychrotolerans DSM 18569]
MKTFITPFRHALLAVALPAAFAFSACSDDDPDPAPVVEQGRVLLSHAAASANIQVKALINDTEVGQLNYGQSSGYLNVNAGTPTLKINNSANQTAASQTITVAKDQSYSAFAYAPTATTVGLLQVTDDLAAPASGQAKVRVVHLAQGAPAVKLSQQTIAGPVDIPNISATFPASATATTWASGFASVPSGPYNLLVTTGATSATVVAVGDGTGTGLNGTATATATKTYEAGKIYTVLVRGILGSIDPALQPRAVVIQHN